MDKKTFDNIVDFLKGNIVRIVLTKDEDELLTMAEFAKLRIDALVEYKINEIKKIEK